MPDSTSSSTYESPCESARRAASDAASERSRAREASSSADLRVDEPVGSEMTRIIPPLPPSPIIPPYLPRFSWSSASSRSRFSFGR